ncbi:MAG TPA: NUDIX hydrolase [Candidatus Nanoarchaeia archaeon]|nr:NUDIX hydrolase [Candidatus Nanoarchaeia archaeon]
MKIVKQKSASFKEYPRRPSFTEYLQEHFKQGPFLATDILIEYDGELVLIERLNYPFGLALPGGIAEPGLSLPENARKEAKEETGLDVHLYSPEDVPFCVKSHPLQDPRAQIVAVAYQAVGHGVLKAGDDAKAVRVCSREEIAQLVNKPEAWAMPHHREIVDYYLRTHWSIYHKQ